MPALDKELKKVISSKNTSGLKAELKEKYGKSRYPKANRARTGTKGMMRHRKLGES